MRALNLDAIRERAQALDRQAKVEFFRNASTEVLNLCDEVERLRSIVAEVQAALAGHPECDKYGPDDVISCGWKKAVADVQRAVEGVEP